MCGAEENRGCHRGIMLCFGQPAALHKKKGGSRGMLEQAEFYFQSEEISEKFVINCSHH